MSQPRVRTQSSGILAFYHAQSHAVYYSLWQQKPKDIYKA